jgi:hypothetical protein
MAESSGRSHHIKSYVGVSTPTEDRDEPDVQEAVHHAAELALEDTEVDNRGKLFDIRLQLVLSNPHIKEVRATITQSDTTT